MIVSLVIFMLFGSFYLIYYTLEIAIFYNLAANEYGFLPKASKI